MHAETSSTSDALTFQPLGAASRTRFEPARVGRRRQLQRSPHGVRHIPPRGRRARVPVVAARLGARRTAGRFGAPIMAVFEASVGYEFRRRVWKKALRIIQPTPGAGRKRWSGPRPPAHTLSTPRTSPGVPRSDANPLSDSPWSDPAARTACRLRQIFGAAGHLKNLFRRRVAPAGAPRSGARGAQGSQKDQRGVCGSLRIVATTENIPKRGPKGAKISFLMAKNRRAEKLTAARRRWVRPTIDRARDRQARLRCP